MIALPTCYLIASAVALKVAALSYERDRRHAVQIAAVLMLGCGCYNTTWLTHAWWFWSPMDAVIAWFVAVRCRKDYRPWKLLIVLASFVQIMCHARWQIGDKFDHSAYAYHLTLNMLFLVQLAAVASSGSRRVRRAVCDYVVDRFSPRRGRGVAILRRPEPVRPRKG